MTSNSTQSLILILASIHRVLKAEKVLKKAALPFDLVPVPKEVNPDCGLAIEITPLDLEQVREALSRAGVRIEFIYQRSGQVFQQINISKDR